LIKRVESVNCNSEIDEVLEKYNVVFKGLGCFPGEYKIKIKDNNEGILNPPRRVAESIKKELSKTLSDMRKGVIVEVERPKGWSSNVVIVENLIRV